MPGFSLFERSTDTLNAPRIRCEVAARNAIQVVVTACKLTDSADTPSPLSRRQTVTSRATVRIECCHSSCDLRSLAEGGGLAPILLNKDKLEITPLSRTLKKYLEVCNEI